MFSHFRFWISLWLRPQPDAISSKKCLNSYVKEAAEGWLPAKGSREAARLSGIVMGLCHPFGYIEGWGVTTGWGFGALPCCSTLTSWYYLMPNVFRVAESSSSAPAWGAQSANVGEQCMLPTMPLHGSSWWTEMIGEPWISYDFLRENPCRFASLRIAGFDEVSLACVWAIQGSTSSQSGLFWKSGGMVSRCFKEPSGNLT